MSLSPRKQSQQSESEGFRPGAIVRVTLKDFMTYTAGELRPGPRLNVILGPNGTGKSSIVCGIGLALAGKPSILGRAKTVGSFVRSGQNMGWVEVELYKPKKNVVIKREIFLNNTSIWYLNGRRSTLENVQAEIDALNVQVGNLCQFLAQDRVKEFAKMTPVALLEETERAVGGAEMLSLHKRLVEAQGEHKELFRNVSVESEKLAALKAANAELEREVERYQQRQALLEKVHVLKQKLAWMRVAVKNEEKEELNEALKKQFEMVVQLKESLSSAAELTKAEKNVDACKADIARLKKVLADSDAARRKADGKIQSLLTEYNELEAEIVQLEEGRNLSKRKIAGYKNEISKLEKLNQELPDPSKSGPELATVTKELEALHVEMRKLQDNEKLAMKSTSEKDLALQQKRGALGKLDSDRQVREDRFRSMSYELHNLLLWIRKSQSMFKGTVKGPLALEIQPKSEQAATLLEKLIPKNLLGAFLVTSPEDMDLIRKKGNELGVYGLILFNPRGEVSESSLEREVPGEISKQLRAAGVFGWACDTFVAPLEFRHMLFTNHPAVWRTMCSERPLDERMMKEAQSFKGTMGLLDGKNHFMFSRSQYGNREFSVSTNPYNAQERARVLVCGADVAEKTRLQKEVELAEKALKEAQEQQKVAATALQELLTHKRSLDARKVALSDIPKSRQANLNRIKSKQGLIRDEESVNYDEQEKKAKTKMAKSKIEIAKLLESLSAPIKNMLQASLELDGCVIRLLELEDRVAKFEAQQAKEKEELKAGEKKLQELKTKRDKLKQEVDGLRALATKLCKMTHEVAERFKAIPQETIGDLEMEMHNLESQASAIFASSEDIIRQYEQRKAEISEKEDALTQKQATLDELNKRILLDKTAWLQGRKEGEDPDHPQASVGLIELVKSISASFKKYMGEIDCKGEVVLNMPGDEFANYAIETKVSFRDNAKLQTLSAEFHSGGERSVSTMMYLVSLQPLTPAPFRLVDEINQAMDPVNERKIWEQVVAASSSGDSPQYFLITPKLLSDLTYSDSIVVHVVFNGCYNSKQEEWNENSRFAKREREEEEEEEQDF